MKLSSPDLPSEGRGPDRTRQRRRSDRGCWRVSP